MTPIGRTILCGAVFASLVPAGPIAVLAQGHSRTAAIVLDYKVPSYVTIVRGDQRIPLGTFLEILDGDEVTIASALSAVKLRYTDGSTEEIIEATSPRRIRLRGTPVTTWDKFLGFARGIGSTIDHGRVIPTGTRGPDDPATRPLRLRAPGVAENVALVAAGTRRLGIAWAGGRAPYRVIIRRQGGEALLDATLDAFEVNTPDPRNLTPGRYEVSVQDATAQRAIGSFEAVDPSRRPTHGERVPTWAGPDVTKVVDACHVARSGGPRWAYEAYLSLVGEAQLGTAQAVARGACQRDQRPAP